MTTGKSNIIVVLIFGGFILFRTIFPAQKDDEISNTIFNLSIELVGGIVLYGILQLLQNVKHLKFYFQTQFLYRRKDIRLSLAYLYRIQIDDRYLLVKSSHRDYFQPVGGAYKTLPGSKYIFEKLSVKSDRLIETEKGIAKGDLRVFVKGLNVIEFLEWFDSNQDRETSPWREFCEELISTHIVPWQDFKFINYKFKGRIKTPILDLDSGDKGVFIFDIYDLVPNNDQLKILENLLILGDTEKYIWVDEYHINRLGHNEIDKKYSYRIGQHTKWALNMEWSK
jgi:SMODS-associated NUDIX domain